MELSKATRQPSRLWLLMEGSIPPASLGWHLEQAQAEEECHPAQRHTVQVRRMHTLLRLPVTSHNLRLSVQHLHSRHHRTQHHPSTILIVAQLPRPILLRLRLSDLLQRVPAIHLPRRRFHQRLHGTVHSLRRSAPPLLATRLQVLLLVQRPLVVSFVLMYIDRI